MPNIWTCKSPEGLKFKSRKTELKLTNVARTSLEELRLDYEDHLRHRNLPLWPSNDPRRNALEARRCTTAKQRRFGQSGTSSWHLVLHRTELATASVPLARIDSPNGPYSYQVVKAPVVASDNPVTFPHPFSASNEPAIACSSPGPLEIRLTSSNPPIASIPPPGRLWINPSSGDETSIKPNSPWPAPHASSAFGAPSHRDLDRALSPEAGP